MTPPLCTRQPRITPIKALLPEKHSRKEQDEVRRDDWARIVTMKLGPREVLYDWIAKFGKIVSGDVSATRYEGDKAISGLKHILVGYSYVFTGEVIYGGVRSFAEAVLYALERGRRGMLLG